MDELDQRIIESLQSSAYPKLSALATIFGVSERTIRRRVNTMREQGIIKIVALPNPVLFGYEAWAKIGIKVEVGAASTVAHGLVDNPLVYFVAYSLGRYDFVIAVNFDAIDTLTHFSNFELAKIPGIVSTETMVLTQPRKYYAFSWEPNVLNGKNTFVTGHVNAMVEADNYVVDDVNRAIVELLGRDALTRAAVLGKKLHLKESAIRRRIRAMLKENVFSIQIVVNPRVWPSEVWVTVGITVSKRMSHSVIDDIIKNQAIYLASVTHGRFNIILAARFRNLDLLDQFIHQEVLEIEGVSSVETFLHSRPLKYHNIVWSHNLG